MTAKAKGRRGEYKIRDWLNHIFGRQIAKRVPGSGAFDGLDGDIKLDLVKLGLPSIWTIECKVRAKPTGMASVRKWLNGNDALVVWIDREPRPLVVMWGDSFEQIAERMSNDVDSRRTT